MRILDKQVLSSDNVHFLKGKIYLPEENTQIKGYLHVVHGMTEHIARYDYFMKTMANNGYIVFGYDHLGHGYTATSDSELGFIAHKNGYDLLQKDVKIFSDEVIKEYGNYDYYLLGHSMGSFIVRSATLNYVSPKKLIIMGTGGPNPATDIGIFLIDIIKLFRGEKYISEFIYKMAFGSYNKNFKQENSGISWLTKDLEVRKAYENDRFCSFKFTVSAMRDLLKVQKIANSKKWFKKVDGSIPYLLVSGSLDPVGNNGKGVEKVYKNLIKNGKTATLKLYENCRHEILNDDKKEQVINDILEFLK